MSDNQSQPRLTTVQDAKADLEKRQHEEREMIRTYKRLFATEDGKTVLADLERRTNYKKGPYAHGIGHGDLSYRCGTQDPVRHIREQLDVVLKPLGTKRELRAAKSGTARAS